MSLYLVPPKMRARHHETGQWETLVLDSHAFYIWQQPAPQCYAIDTGDEPIWADLYDFDCFEGVAQ